MSVDLLILGAGWTSKFLIPLLKKEQISYAATSRQGRPGTIRFEWDSQSEDRTQWKSLPDAKSVMITFPVKEGSSKLVQLYNESRGAGKKLKVQWIQLGTTSLWNAQPGWSDRHSKYENTNRSQQEQELLNSAPATILHLSGLWGGGRDPRNWVTRIAPTKESISQKGSLHLIHGEDVARCVLAVHRAFDKAIGQRWIITDERVYDWWDLASSWAQVDSDVSRWTWELVSEHGIRSLPRGVESLGRALDSTEFWRTFGLGPSISLNSDLSHNVCLVGDFE